MTAGNQSQTAYFYDNADWLTQITQGNSTLSFSYDNANRRTLLALPNGIVMSYSYDGASHLRTTTNYIYDGANAVQERSGTTTGRLTITVDRASSGFALDKDGVVLGKVALTSVSASGFRVAGRKSKLIIS
jgi:YD repeat-containing protein